MAKAEWGLKRLCLSCGARFYDLQREPIVCPACGAAYVADLDVAGFVWAELRASAQRLLGEVDTLARAYGWTEPDVLALGERRRAAYLELARGDW